ncbi:unnamed protein product [Camellia sinensis]
MLYIDVKTLCIQASVKEEKKCVKHWVKKEMKGLYRCEAQRARRIDAFTGLSSIHIIFQFLSSWNLMSYFLGQCISNHIFYFFGSIICSLQF